MTLQKESETHLSASILWVRNPKRPWLQDFSDKSEHKGKMKERGRPQAEGIRREIGYLYIVGDLSFWWFGGGSGDDGEEEEEGGRKVRILFDLPSPRSKVKASKAELRRANQGGILCRFHRDEIHMK